MADLSLSGDRLDRALEILRGLVESETAPCSFDHHGYCQEHGWFGDQPGECGVREARQLLGLDPVGAGASEHTPRGQSVRRDNG